MLGSSLVPFPVIPQRRIIIQKHDIGLDPGLGIEIFQPVCQVRVVIDKSQFIQIPLSVGFSPCHGSPLRAGYGDLLCALAGAGIRDERTEKQKKDDDQDHCGTTESAPSSGTSPSASGEDRTSPSPAGTSKMGAERGSSEVRTSRRRTSEAGTAKPRTAGTSARTPSASESSAGTSSERSAAGMTSAAV